MTTHLHNTDLMRWTIDEMREELEHIARHPETCPHAKKGAKQQAKCSLCMAAMAKNALDRISSAHNSYRCHGHGWGCFGPNGSWQCCPECGGSGCPFTDKEGG